ncbi:MAG: DUF1572 family protein [Bacteroidia bacterium]
MKEEFITQCIIRLNENTPRVAKCLNMLSEEEVWQKPNSATNSIANLILHLCGNIRQYIHCGLGAEADDRQRDLEFSTAGGYSKEELLSMLTQTVRKAEQTILECDDLELNKVHMVQGFHLSGIAMIIHVVEHFSYHTGQIALLTKMLKNEDLGFYAGQNLNAHNES